jgi:hypothetical protein
MATKAEQITRINGIRREMLELMKEPITLIEVAAKMDMSYQCCFNNLKAMMLTPEGECFVVECEDKATYGGFARLTYKAIRFDYEMVIKNHVYTKNPLTEVIPGARVFIFSQENEVTKGLWKKREETEISRYNSRKPGNTYIPSTMGMV